MATDRRYTGRRIAVILVVAGLLVPAVANWLDSSLLGTLDGPAAVRLVGLGVVLALVARWAVRQRGRNRDGRLGNRGRTEADDASRGEHRDAEGTGDE